MLRDLRGWYWRTAFGENPTVFSLIGRLLPTDSVNLRGIKRKNIDKILATDRSADGRPEWRGIFKTKLGKYVLVRYAMGLQPTILVTKNLEAALNYWPDLGIKIRAEEVATSRGNESHAANLGTAG